MFTSLTEIGTKYESHTVGNNQDMVLEGIVTYPLDLLRTVCTWTSNCNDLVKAFTWIGLK